MRCNHGRRGNKSYLVALAVSVAVALVLALPTPAAARPGLRARVARWIQDAKVVLRPLRGGSIESYVAHCQMLGTGETFKLAQSRTRSGAVRQIGIPRQVAEVKTSRWGLRRYLHHVGASTVELVFNPSCSEYGHMLIRAGKQYYELNGVRSAAAGTFGLKAWGMSGVVGMVYSVDPKKLPEIQRELAQLVKGAGRNLPPFDSYGNPVRLVPKAPATGQAGQTGQMETFTIASSQSGRFRAQGTVQARRVMVDGKLHLESADGLRVPVVGQRTDGSLSIDSMSCTSFPTGTLARMAPELGFGQLSSHAQRYARSAVTNLVRGDTPAVPQLVTVYTNGRLDPRKLVNDIGKSDPKP